MFTLRSVMTIHDAVVYRNYDADTMITTLSYCVRASQKGCGLNTERKMAAKVVRGSSWGVRPVRGVRLPEGQGPAQMEAQPARKRVLFLSDADVDIYT